MKTVPDQSFLVRKEGGDLREKTADHFSLKGTYIPTVGMGGHPAAGGPLT